jgi:N-acetylglutamate synthase-like GNAT family acetyltransferase
MIRQAELSDLNDIVRIRESVTIDMDRLDDLEYRVDMQRNGFLLPSGPNAEELREELSQYSVSEHEEQVVGSFYVHADQIIPQEQNVFWLKPNLRDAYYSSPQGRIGGISVSPDSRQKGVATEMLHAAEKRFRAEGIHWLFAFIVLTPVTNFASMMFHEKNGFDRVATSSPYLFEAGNGFQIEGYQFMLYGKQLAEA